MNKNKRQLTEKEVVALGVHFLPIKEFIKDYSIEKTVEAIAYHMKSEKIDFMQPGRDKFVVLTDATKTFYKIPLNK